MHNAGRTQDQGTFGHTKVKLGIDVLVEDNFSVLDRMRIGLITNQTGIDSRFVPTWRRLFEASNVKLAALFGPEHGWQGAVQDALDVPSATDPITGLPVYSLYDQSAGQVKPRPDMLEGLDALLFDIQDVGARFYTYVYTMTFAMEACAEVGLPFVVLDRPNPLGGCSVEGNVLDPEFASFLGRYPIALRHAMTAGEFAQYCNAEFNIGCDLTVIPSDGWKRCDWYDETGLPTWVMPSPNLPTLEATTIYIGTCLFEGTNISEGRGTTRPFELVGAPWIDSLRWADMLNERDLPGVVFRAASFIPTFWKFADEVCHGVQVHVLDRKVFQPVATALHMIDSVRTLHPKQFAWRPDPGATKQSGITPWFFDLLLGTDRVRLQFEEGVAVEEILRSWIPEREAFSKQREQYLLYR